MLPLEAKVTDLGEFSVARVLPNRLQRMVGPFVFLDHMGPAEFDAGEGVNVRPHPHIGLATLTYLLEGRILHRDSLGNCVEIHPGDVNWMVAGKGITHSERETIEVKSVPHRLDGLQCWVALPAEQAEVDPSFTHVSKDKLPHRIFEAVTARLIIGAAYGMESPIDAPSPMFMLDIITAKGARIERPNPGQECLLMLLRGALTVNGEQLPEGEAAVIDNDALIETEGYSRLIMLGGEMLDDKPHLVWNFVSFDRDRIEQAKQDWQAGRFAAVVGDDQERIPLP